jgi:hypothetical protein
VVSLSTLAPDCAARLDRDGPVIKRALADAAEHTDVSSRGSKNSSPQRAPRSPVREAKELLRLLVKVIRVHAPAGSSPPTGFRRRLAQYLRRWAVLGSNQ